MSVFEILILVMGEQIYYFEHHQCSRRWTSNEVSNRLNTLLDDFWNVLCMWINANFDIISFSDYRANIKLQFPCKNKKIIIW